MRSMWVPTPIAAASEAAKGRGWLGKEGFLSRKVLGWKARPAASLLGGMKQPRISAGRAKCGSSSQSISSNCLGSQGARCQVQHCWCDPEEHRNQHAAWGAWPPVSNNPAEAIAGREHWGSGREREKPHPLGPRTVQLVQAERRRRQVLFQRTQHLCTTSRVTLSVREHRR